MKSTPMLFPGQGFGAQPFRLERTQGRRKVAPTLLSSREALSVFYASSFFTIRKSIALGRAVSRRGRVIGGSASGYASPYCGIPSQGRGRAKAMG